MSGLQRRIFARSSALVAVLALVGALCAAAPAGAVSATVSGITPGAGATGNTVTVSGIGFTGSQLSAVIAGQSVAMTVTSNTSATFTVPASAGPGTTSVTFSDGTTTLSPSFPFVVFQFTNQITEAEVGVNYNPRILVTGGRAPYTWSIVSGTLLSGLSFSVFGVFAGVPKIAGSAPLTVQATDANGLSAQITVTVTVDPGPSVANLSAPPATIGSPYSVIFGAIGGTPPYQWAINSGPIPGGLVLSSTGVLAGIPGALGSTNVTIRVTDALGSIGTKTFPIVVRPVAQSVTLLTASGTTELVSTFNPPSVALAPSLGLVGVASSIDGTKTWFASGSGKVFAGPGTLVLGQVGGVPKRPIVSIAARSDGLGYWLVTAAGHVYAFGAAHDYGSVKGRIAGRVVGLSPTPNGRGYLIVTSKGHIYRFGNAPKITSPRAARFHGRVIGASITADGKGAFVASTSGVVLGLGSARLEKIRTPAVAAPVVAIVPSPGGNGYWLITALGGVVPAGAAEALTTLPVPPGVVTAAASSH